MFLYKLLGLNSNHVMINNQGICLGGHIIKSNTYQLSIIYAMQFVVTIPMKLRTYSDVAHEQLS